MFDQNGANGSSNMNNANQGMGNIPNNGMQGIPNMGVPNQDPAMGVDPNMAAQNANAAANGANVNGAPNAANGSWQQPRLEIDGLEEVREGVYANIALARTSPKESILDFVFVDSNEPDAQGNVVTRGKFQARIIMSNASLIELRDMLDKHIAQHAPVFPLGNIAN